MLKDWKFDLQLFADGDEPGNEPPEDEPKDKPKEEPKTFDEAYVKKLRDEAASHRTKAKDLETKLAATTQETMAKVLKALGLEPDPNKNYEQQLADANKKAQEAEEKANARLIQAEVKMQAVSLQIIDPDAAYALMDRSRVQIGDDGVVSGVKEALEALAKDKPYLVGKAGSTQVGSGSNPGTGGGNDDPVEQARKLAEDRNKGQQAPVGGYDPWSRK